LDLTILSRFYCKGFLKKLNGASISPMLHLTWRF